MNDHDICMYLSESGIALICEALRQYGQTVPDRADETTALVRHVTECRDEFLDYEEQQLATRAARRLLDYDSGIGGNDDTPTAEQRDEQLRQIGEALRRPMP